MSRHDSIEIPTFHKKNIQINQVEVLHGGQIRMVLTFKHREDCFIAGEFFNKIVNAMIEHSSDEEEKT